MLLAVPGELVEPATTRALTLAKRAVPVVPSRLYPTCLLPHCRGCSSCTHLQALHIVVVLAVVAVAVVIPVTADREVAVAVS